MPKQLDPEDLRQYTDGELPAEILAEYPVAKQYHLEAPDFSQPVQRTVSREARRRDRQQRLIKTFTFFFWLSIVYAGGYVLLPLYFKNITCGVFYVLAVIVIILDALSVYPTERSEILYKEPAIILPEDWSSDSTSNHSNHPY